MTELIKWLISAVVVAVVGCLIILYPEILLAVALFLIFICLVGFAKMLIFDVWRL